MRSRADFQLPGGSCFDGRLPSRSINVRGGHVSPAAAVEGGKLGISKMQKTELSTLCGRVYKLLRASTNWQRSYVKSGKAEEGTLENHDQVLGTATSRHWPRRGCNVAVLEDRWPLQQRPGAFMARRRCVVVCRSFYACAALRVDACVWGTS